MSWEHTNENNAFDGRYNVNNQIETQRFMWENNIPSIAQTTKMEMSRSWITTITKVGNRSPVNMGRNKYENE